jgi:hypothetical protein
MKRWRAEISYPNGIAVHTFEEIEELHNIVERGPDWNCIENIVITLNRGSAHSSNPRATP